MVTTMVDIARWIMPRYGVELQDMEQIGNGFYWVQTDRGSRWLFEREDQAAVQVQFEVMEHLAKSGFRRIPRHIRTIHGDSFVPYGGRIYWLTDEWEGRVPHYNREDLTEAAKNLARLHNSLQELKMDVRKSVPTRYGTWLNTFASCKEHLHSTMEAWKKENHRDCFQEVMDNYAPWLEGVMEQSVDYLMEGDYEKRSGDHQQQGSLCYGEYRLEQLRISEDGRIATLGFETMAGDMPLYDLARFSHILMEEGKGAYLSTVIHAYEEERTLHPQEKRILLGYWNFPHGIYRILAAYQRVKKSPEKFVELLQQGIDRWGINQPHMLDIFNDETSQP